MAPIAINTLVPRKTARMPIFFGATGSNTQATIANVRFAKDNGADGAILAAPAYICAPETDIERLFGRR